MGKYKKLPENYFKFTNPVVVSLVGAGVYLTVMSWLDPENISTTYFGRVGELAVWLGTHKNNVMKQLTLIAVALHVFEAVVAVYLCQRLRLNGKVTAAWALQTLAVGIFSLRFLIWPQRELKEFEKGSNNSKKD